jgi:hypothetical protein
MDGVTEAKRADASTEPLGGGVRWWTAALVGVANALTSTGFGIAALVSTAGLPRDDGARIYAMYAAARTLPLAVLAVALMARRARSAMLAVSALLGAVQLCDALVGLAQADVGKTLGPTVVGLVTLAAVVVAVRDRPSGTTPRSALAR